MAVPNDPRELGLPLRQWRPFQKQTIEAILESPNETVHVVSAPTGVGKSAIALGLGLAGYSTLAPETRTTILTNQISLQEQYLGYEMDDVRAATGRSNHRCILEHPGVSDNTTAATAPCTTGYVCEHAKPTRTDDPLSIPCPYFFQREMAERSKIRVLNYPYFLLQAQHDRFKSNYLVCDEGHRLDKSILDAETVKLTDQMLRQLSTMKLQPPRMRHGCRFTEVRGLGSWVDNVLIGLGSSHPRSEQDQHLLRNMTAAFEKLRTFVQWKVTGLVLYSREFVPLLTEEIAPRTLLRGLKLPGKLVVLSASIFDREYIAARLGIDAERSVYTEIPSDFPVDRRRIYLKPVAKLNYLNTKEEETLNALSASVDNIARRFAKFRGVVHCGSFELGSQLYERSQYKDRMILAAPGENRLDDFRRSEYGVYISPSAYEGLDLKDDLCRFNIVAKLSWPNRSDPVVAARLDLIPRYNDYETASALIQAMGRGVRDREDWCSNFILDGTFYQLWGRVKDILPGWFKSAIVFPLR